MTARTCLAIVLAAGEGTRMRSARPKVLHTVAGQSLLAHVLTAVGAAGTTATAVVVGPGQDEVAAEAKRVLPGAATFVQRERRGTAHAVVLAAKATIDKKPDDILVVDGDTPLIRPDTLTRLRAARQGCGGCGAGVSAVRSDRATAVSSRQATSSLPFAARRPMPARASAKSSCATAASWRSPAKTRSPFCSGSATTIANTNFISPMRSRSHAA